MTDFTLGCPAPLRARDRQFLPARSAFTLIELLIVVSIISILAAIAVPNFLEAQTRAKVARVQADMRSLATAIEAYMVDWNKYPRRRFTGGTAIQPAFPNANLRVDDMRAVTSPISYISLIPQDVFENRVAPPNNLLDYWGPNIFERRWEVSSSNNRVPTFRGWVLLSVGPDTLYGQLPTNAGNLPFPELAIGTFDIEYDPTNGTVSLGNVTRSQSGETLRQLLRK